MNSPAACRLEAVMVARCSTRAFAPEPPSRDQLERVVRAGFHAPYAVIGTRGRETVRSFVVLERGTVARTRVHEAFLSRARRFARLGASPLAAEVLRVFDAVRTGRWLPTGVYRQMGVLAQHAATERGHFAHLRDAPVFVLVAERNRAPAMARTLIRQSLAHCMQNMWLMATVQGLAFQMLSLTSALGDDGTVCELLGARRGDFELDGCLIGRPATERPARANDSAGARAATIWPTE